MSRQECIHDMDPAWCGVCKHGVTKPEPTTVVGAPFYAKFDGHCRVCNLPIVGGWRTLVVRMSDDSYRHEGCA